MECGTLCEYFVFVCRIWGLLTALSLWGVGVETVYFNHYIGVGIIIVAGIVSFLESLFLLKYLSGIDFKCKCSRNRCHDCLLSIDDWRKGLLYLLLSIVCFVKGHILWLPIISGSLLVVCALLYSLKTIKTRMDAKTDFLFVPETSNENYDEIEEIADELDDNSIINPRSTIPSMSVAEQSDILEV